MRCALPSLQVLEHVLSLLTLFHTTCQIVFKKGSDHMRERVASDDAAAGASASQAEAPAGVVAGVLRSAEEEAAEAQRIAALVTTPRLLAAMRDGKWGRYLAGGGVAATSPLVTSAA